MGTQGNYLYRPSYGAKGTAEYTTFDNGLLSADSVLTSAASHISSASSHTIETLKATIVTATNISATTITATNIIVGETWTDVRFHGAKGDGTTDDTTAILAANTAAKGHLFFPSGIYCMSAAFPLRSATEYRGPLGGTFLHGQEHPTAGYGACIKWTGANSGTMVRGDNVMWVKWHGIDLDGVAVSAAVKGFVYDTDNTARTGHIHMTNFRGFNLDTGLTIADSGTENNCDHNTIDHFEFYRVNTGIYLNSGNVSFSTFSNGAISFYDKGIHIAAGGYLTLSQIAGAYLANPTGDDAFLTIGSNGALQVIGIQAEPGVGGLTANLLRMVVFKTGSTYTPVTFSSCWFDYPIEVQNPAGTRKFTSIGCYYRNTGGAAGGIILNGTDNLVTSVGDYFEAGAGVYDPGAGSNNQVTLIDPYLVGAGTSTIAYKKTQNNALSYSVNFTGDAGCTQLTATTISGTDVKATTLTGTTFSGTDVKVTTVTGAYLEAYNAAGSGSPLLTIGSSPTYKFDMWRYNIDGSLNIQGNQTGYNNILLCPQGGKVGIGVASPSAALEVSGSIYTDTATATTVKATTLTGTTFSGTAVKVTTVTGTTVCATTFSGAGGATDFAYSGGGSATIGAQVLTAHGWLQANKGGGTVYIPVYSSITVS